MNFESNFRFTENLKERYRFPICPLPPYMHSLPHYQHQVFKLYLTDIKLFCQVAYKFSTHFQFLYLYPCTSTNLGPHFE